ncbi:MAG TPA: glycosyltransferase, partial [Microbacterium sp.]|nr:glycosyltransferase [Microbacterium sp.]
MLDPLVEPRPQTVSAPHWDDDAKLISSRAIARREASKRRDRLPQGISTPNSLGDFVRARRRQWGAEKRLRPLPSIHARPSDRKVILGRLAIIATIVFWMTYVIYTVVRQFLTYGTESFRFTTEAVSYLVVVTFLTFSALMYLVARQGALQRFASHTRVARMELDRHFASSQGSMTVLVPSYAEEPNVIRQTLWSAALQEYPSLRVVLLLDDPPDPSDPVAASRLERSRAITTEIRDALSEPARRLSGALFRAQTISADVPVHREEVEELADHFLWASEWLSAQAAAEKVDDHVGYFFVEQVILRLAADLERTGAALHAGAREGTGPSRPRLLEMHRRLAWTFCAEMQTFERKQYASLSHEANKAMNLNAYIGLMGADYRRVVTESGTILRPVSGGEAADLEVPDSVYVLTLDADSLLLREYCLRLVYLLEQPGNERVAVTQTPYSAFRGAPTRIERLAAATTDLQHILHQGKSHYNATFWVGANAIIRKRALDDIVRDETVGGFLVRRYVQDRTVIEDTESSVDLAVHGWTLINYPERLSYSATPPDFGSLVVQRRRWANGGLLILPKLWRQ